MRPVVFDLDGVLIDSEPHYELAFAEYLEQIGRGDARELFALTLGRRNVDCFPELAARLDRTAEEIEQGLERAVAPHLKTIRPLPNALEAVRSLREDGHPLALATSSEEALVKGLLSRLGLNDAFDAVVTAAEVERGKPDPAVYRLAAERLSANPASCVAVEDTPAGVAAAMGAGMHCIAVTNTVVASELARADALAADLKQVVKRIRMLGDSGGL